MKLEGDGPHELAWDVLSCFEFTKQKETGGEGKGEIPAQIKAIAGKKITVTGFSLPVRMRGNTGEIAEVLLLRNPLQCCYGVAPRANEWIHVNLSDDVKVDSSTGRMTVTGVLEVGEEYRDGWLASIYRLTNARAEAVK